MMRLSSVVAAAFAAVFGLGPAAACAATTPPPPPTRTSSIWSGYVVTGHFHRITAGWTEPAVDCTQPGWIQRVSPWVGLNGYEVDGRAMLPLMQTGTLTLCHSDPAILASLPGNLVERAAAGVAGAGMPGAFTALIYLAQGLNAGLGMLAGQICVNTECDWQQEKLPWSEAYAAAPVPYDAAVFPGDRMRATVTGDGRRYVMTLADTTRHWQRTTVRMSPAPARTAEVVVEGLLGNPLPRFTPVTFVDITVDGKPLASRPTLQRTVLATVDGARTGPSPLAGTTFQIRPGAA